MLDDGGEAHPDLGLYERTMDLHLRRENHITLGKIYEQVNEAERRCPHSCLTQYEGALILRKLKMGVNEVHEPLHVSLCGCKVAHLSF